MGEKLTIQATVSNYVGRLPFLQRAATRILRGGASVFLFHRILPQDEECYNAEMATSKEAFTSFLDWLGEAYRVLPLDLVATRRGQAMDRDRPLCALTFDDGWLDNFTHAFPLLQERRFPATIFLAVRFIGTSRRFWQERLWACLQKLKNSDVRLPVLEQCFRQFPWFPPNPTLPRSYRTLMRFLMTRPSEDAEEFVQSLEEFANLTAVTGRSFLNWEEVQTMQRAGIAFGSHTLHHSLLTNAAPRLSEVEICRSREELSERLGADVTAFAYPWGRSNRLSRRQVEGSGYSFAVTATGGLIDSSTSPWLVPRIAVNSSVLLGQNQLFAPKKVLFSFAKGVVRSSLFSGVPKDTTSNTDRIRIAFIIDLIDGWHGGTESQLHALIRTLDSCYFDPELICIFPFSSLPLDSFPCRVHFLCGERSRPPALARLLRLVRLLRRIRPHVVQTYFPEANTLGIYAAWLANTPAIVGTSRNTTDRKKASNRFMGRLAGKLADCWQCNSRAAWAYEHENTDISANKLEILPNAVDLNRFSFCDESQRNRMRLHLGLDPRTPIIVSVANFRPVKDLATLVNAAWHVHQKLPNACFLLVGDGPMLDEMQQQVHRLNLQDVVKLVGGKSDVTPYLAAADIGVLTSLSEGSSNSLLEYMAIGLPPVVSKIPANLELVEGLFFTPGDARDLADKLISLSEDAAFAKQLSKRHKQMISQFAPDAFLRRAEGFYARLLPDISEG